MKRIIVFCIAALLVSDSLLAQSNQTESLTFTTYFPAPYGVYRVLRFLPNNAFNPGDYCVQEGDTSFDRITSELYVCKGPFADRKWRRLGSGGIAGNRVLSGNGVIADTCSGILVGTATESVCSEPFYKDITFKTPFSSPPRVAVTLQWVTNSWNPRSGIWPTYPRSNCAQSGTDRFVSYPTNISATGFRLWASGSPESKDCGGAGTENYFSHAYAGWIAIGD